MPRARSLVVFLCLALPGLLGASSCGTSPGAVPGADGGPSIAPPAPSLPEASGAGLPCDVQKILADNCWKCHSDPTKFTAPMPLTTHAALTAGSKSDPSKKVYELVSSRLRDDKSPMPPSPNARLSAADMAVLEGWAAAGAPSSTATCTAPPPPPGDAGPVEPLDCAPDLSIKPSEPWAMPQTDANEYVCYGVDVESPTDKHITALTPRIQNPAIVHHVLVFKSDTAYPTKPQKCPSGGSLQWRLMYGWAPGGKNMVLPKEAGFALPAGKQTHFIVQVHYNNARGLTGQSDTSGVDLCTSAPRANEAEVLAFGTQKIDLPRKSELDKTCSVTVPAALAGKKIFAAMPHMHELGYAIDTKLYKAGGGAPIDLGTVPRWDFNQQYWQPLDATIGANDVVKTHCAWKNPTTRDVKFGENTEDEMCYSFTMYYPRIDSGLWSWAVPALGSQCVTN